MEKVALVLDLLQGLSLQADLVVGGSEHACDRVDLGVVPGDGLLELVELGLEFGKFVGHLQKPLS